MKRNIRNLINGKSQNDCGTKITFGVDSNQYWQDVYSQKENNFKNDIL